MIIDCRNNNNNLFGGLKTYIIKTCDSNNMEGVGGVNGVNMNPHCWDVAQGCLGKFELILDVRSLDE